MGTTLSAHGPGSTVDGRERVQPFDEMRLDGGDPRPLHAPLWSCLQQLGSGGLADRQRAIDRAVADAGVTFGVAAAAASTGDGDLSTASVAEPTGRSWSLDPVPRLVDAAEWTLVAIGLVQRLRALNAFIDDCYHEQRAIGCGVVPADLVLGSPNFRPACVGVDPPNGVWAPICGSDLVRTVAGDLVVLEDNLRIPSGAAYMVENRQLVKQVLPELFRPYSVEPVEPYLGHLRSVLGTLAPRPAGTPAVVVLTPGPANAAYFEHAHLAHHLGAALVESTDLVVDGDDRVHVRTIAGLQPVDVVYRRVDDLFLDPEVFRPDSLVGVPGLMRAWRRGTVAIVNAPGTGVADDKAIYPFVPELIRFFLDEEPLLGDVPTWWCGRDDDRRFVLDHLPDLVVKPVGDAGGYGVVVGPEADREALSRVARRIEHHPEGWVAQPVIELSTAPTWAGGALEDRHVDLRPFTLLGPDRAHVSTGGLTRVASRPGCRIVNSSQGGTSKDTWVVTGLLEDVVGRRSGAGTIRCVGRDGEEGGAAGSTRGHRGSSPPMASEGAGWGSGSETPRDRAGTAPRDQAGETPRDRAGTAPRYREGAAPRCQTGEARWRREVAVEWSQGGQTPWSLGRDQ